MFHCLPKLLSLPEKPDGGSGFISEEPTMQQVVMGYMVPVEPSINKNSLVKSVIKTTDKKMKKDIENIQVSFI